jgi:surface protein
MPDKSSYTNPHNPQISEGLQNFINAMVEEIVLKSEAFDHMKKKYLKKYSEAEGVNYSELEANLNDFFEAMQDYQRTKANSIIKLLEIQANTCFIEKSLLTKLVSQYLKNILPTEKKNIKIESNNIQSRNNNPIIANDSNLQDIVISEIKRFGNFADLNHIDVSKITNMEFLFCGSEFNGDISKWNVSNVTNMGWMFFKSQFNRDISSWDISNVLNMEWMFAESMFQKDVSRWIVSKDVNLDSMFYESELEKENKLPKWYKK